MKTHTHQHSTTWSLSSTNCHPSMLNRYLATTSSNTTKQILRFYDVNTALPTKYMHDHINSVF